MRDTKNLKMRFCRVDFELFEDMLEYTVLGYKKGSKPQIIFSDFENMYFQLSNALSNVFICCLEPKIERSIKYASRFLENPPKKKLSNV